ncbi:MAG: hypothetical protein WCX74_03175 [Candidatus Paceibacterota bacterium]
MKFFSTSHLFRLKNLSIFFLIFSVSLILFPSIAQADAFGDATQVLSNLGNMLGSGITGEIGKAVIGALITGLTVISVTLLNYGLAFLNWTASGDFIQANMMTSTDNPIIAAGWGAMRNMANILLIFGLVAIAISIMVGYEENKAKRLLVQFVITALLINFTPVLCGVVIDVANIIMASFLKGGVSPAMISAIENAKQSATVDDLGAAFIFTLISFVTFFIYLLYGALFMVRYIWLWMLIILSPIALATRVFPDNEYLHYILPEQCQWKKWKGDFLQWAFIGVPAALTIYLSETMMAAVVANPHLVTSDPSGNLAGVFSKVFSMIIPVAILIIGFTMTVSKGGWVGGKIGGVWNDASGRIKGFAKDQTLGRAGRVYNRFTEGMAISRAETAEARARGEKVGAGQNLKRQLTGGSKNAYRQSVDSVKDSITSRVPFTSTEKDKEISDKARGDYVKEMKDWSDAKKDERMASKDMSLRAIAQRDDIAKERAEKGKLKEADVNAILANPYKYSEDTRKAVMKSMPNLVPQLSDEKDKKISTLANIADREREQKKFDNEATKDFMKKMTIGERKKIAISSAMNNSSVMMGLDEKEFTSIINRAKSSELKDYELYNRKLLDAREVIRGLPSTTGIANVAEARVIQTTEQEKVKDLTRRASELRRIQRDPTVSADRRRSAAEEETKLRDVLDARRKFLREINL